MNLVQLLSLASVETWLGLVASALFLSCLFISDFSEKDSGFFSLLGLGVSLLLVFLNWHATGSLLNGSFKLDHFAWFFKGFFVAAGFLVIHMTRAYQNLKDHTGEFNFLILLVVLGACFLVSAGSFAAAFVAIELMTMALYVLTGYLKKNDRSIEAGSKYLIMGAFSSGVMLYGISLIYGTCGNLSFEGVSLSLSMFRQIPNLFYAGLILFFAGIGFKIALFPFQLWVADVYEGSPTPITALLSIVSKTAGFAILIRVLSISQLASDIWAPLLCLLSAFTILYGNLGALAQLKGNMKRLMGFSSISHAGYLLLGAATYSILGLQAMLYYFVVYGVANSIIFLSIVLAQSKDDSIDSFKGLFRASPIIGVSMFIAFLSLAGIPPLGGFVAKFFILQAVVEKGILWLAFLGAINITISLYYYLIIVKTIYIEQPKTDHQINVSLSSKFVLFVLSGSLIFLGIYQSSLFSIISKAVTFN